MGNTLKRQYSWFTFVVLLIYIIYDMRGGFYTSGSILSKSAVVLNIFIGFIIIFKYYYKDFRKKIIFKYHLLLILLIILYWLFSEKYVVGRIGEAIGRKGTWDFLKCFLYANVTCYTFYVLRKYKGLSTRSFLIWSIILIVVNVISMHHNRLAILAAKEYDAMGQQMAQGYFFATLMPVSFLIKNKMKRLFFAGVLVMFALISVKRGAILLAILQFIIVMYYTYIKDNGKLKIRGIIIGMLIFSVFVYCLYHYVSADEYMMRRLEKTLEGDSSNREWMYADMWNIFISSSFLELLFGHGMIKTVDLIGNYAHNDWLESLIDFGLFFTTIFALFLFKIRRLYNATKGNDKIIWMMIFISFIFKSIVSMGIYSLEFYNVFAIIGFMLGKSEKTYVNK